MVALPLIVALLSLACALLLVVDAVKRPRPDQIAWAIAFGFFALAAGAEVAGDLVGWSATLARLYYLSGAVLVVGYLALGELYLLIGRRIDRFAPGLTCWSRRWRSASSGRRQSTTHVSLTMAGKRWNGDQG